MPMYTRKSSRMVKRKSKGILAQRILALLALVVVASLVGTQISGSWEKADSAALLGDLDGNNKIRIEDITGSEQLRESASDFIESLPKSIQECLARETSTPGGNPLNCV